LFKERDGKYLLMIFSLSSGILSLLPWVIYAIPSQLAAVSHGWGRPGFKAFCDTLLYSSHYVYNGLATFPRQICLFAWIFGLVMLCLSMAGIERKFHFGKWELTFVLRNILQKGNIGPIILIAVLLLVFPAVFLVNSLSSHPAWMARHLIPGTALLPLILALALRNMKLELNNPNFQKMKNIDLKNIFVFFVFAAVLLQGWINFQTNRLGNDFIPSLKNIVKNYPATSILFTPAGYAKTADYYLCDNNVYFLTDPELKYFGYGDRIFTYLDHTDTEKKVYPDGGYAPNLSLSEIKANENFILVTWVNRNYLAQRFGAYNVVVLGHVKPCKRDAITASTIYYLEKKACLE